MPGLTNTASKALAVAAMVTGLIGSGAAWRAALAAEASAAIPNFAPDSRTGWIPDRPTGDDFLPPAGGPGPVMSAKDHPYVPNGRGQQPTYRIADLSNPILQPWAIERMRKANDEVLAEKSRTSPGSDAGRPAFRASPSIPACRRSISIRSPPRSR